MPMLVVVVMALACGLVAPCRQLVSFGNLQNYSNLFQKDTKRNLYVHNEINKKI